MRLKRTTRYYFQLYPPESGTALWYSPETNRFWDDDGQILHDLSDLFDTWELDAWKKTRDYGILRTKTGDWCELYYQYPAFEMEVVGL